MTLLVTGGAGFIGSALLRHLHAHTASNLVNVDKLTYAGNLESLPGLNDSARYAFEQLDICDHAALARVFERHQPDAVIHLAAETHVDRSIDSPDVFVRTNVLGTATLLEVALGYFRKLPPPRAKAFRFVQVSTDEVYGDLGDSPAAFTENAPYRPNSPYSATKAASDHLVRAWHRTYGLPVLIAAGSNNYGPCQFPEKFIPHMILTALAGRPMPVYGRGTQVRDWLHVDDHVRALCLVLKHGVVGETYNIGGRNGYPNIDVARRICALLEVLSPRPSGSPPYESLITFVEDRAGHDACYRLDSAKVQRDLGWEPQQTFDAGLESTVRWYLENRGWWERVLVRYRLERLGGRCGAAPADG